MKKLERYGLSTVELVVAIAIIALLVAILLPAVQSARESSRRVQCQSRLQEFGKGIGAYESAHGVFPPAQPPTMRLRDGTAGSTTFLSPHSRLLPFLDQQPVFGQLNYSANMRFFLDPAQAPAVSRAIISTFLCPSDIAGQGTNYRTCTGPSPYAVTGPLDPGGGLGAFPALRELRPSDFRDGLSSTIAVSEKLKSPPLPHAFSPADFWFSATFDLLGYQPPTDAMVEICDTAPADPPHFQPNCGRTWLITGYDYTWYNHCVGPNARGADCSVLSYPGALATASGGGVYRASSRHRAGVNCVFVDGHTQFISHHVDVEVWRALSTRSGADPVSNADY